MDNLTNDAKKLLCLLYKDYLDRVKSGESKSKANYWPDSDEITSKFVPKWDNDYTSEICWELCRDGYLLCMPGDDLANEVTLSRKTIAYMEHRFKNNVLGVADFISKFIP